MRIIRDNPANRLGGALSALTIGGILAVLTGSCASPPPPSPASGLYADRLARLDAALESYVEAGTLPGAVALVTHRGETAYLKAFGHRDREAGDPLEVDDIFRIASQTKALVSVAIMILQEDGRLLISGPGRPPPPRIPGDHGRQRQTRRDVRRRAGAAADHHPAPAHPYRGDRLRPGARHRGMGRSGDHRLVLRPPGRADSRNGAAHGVASLRRPARRTLGLRLRDRHPGGGRRGRLGSPARRVPPDPRLRTARHGGHPLLSPTRKAGSPHRRVFGRRRRPHPRSRPRRHGGTGGLRRRAADELLGEAPASFRRPPTTGGSSR